MKTLALLCAVYLACQYSTTAQRTVFPDINNYTHLFSYVTQRLKNRPVTTMRPLKASPGDPEHFDYMINKYQRDFGSQVSSGEEFNFTPPPNSRGETDPQSIRYYGKQPEPDISATETQAEITVTEIMEVTDNHVPEHQILQLIKELANKGLRVFSKLRTVNKEQKEEHFPWKYMTEHPEYQAVATSLPSSPATFENEQARKAYDNKTKEAIVQELFQELRSAMELGEQRKKELMKEKTPTSAEAEQMREYYQQTKHWYQPIDDYTTWDGGERHVTLTPGSEERQTLSRETIKKYDTLEVYHEFKAKEEREMMYDEENDGTQLTQPMRSTNTQTKTSPNFEEKITINWKAMSNIMYHYISQVTLPVHNKFTNTSIHMQHTTTPVTIEAGVSITTTETNKLLDEYIKYLTEMGQTIEPPTTNFLVERFPRRQSSDEIAKRKFYSKNPHFVEKFARRLNSLEQEKRRSRLSTPSTLSTATWAYTTFKKNTYNEVQRKGIEEYFRLNNISTNPEFFGETTARKKKCQDHANVTKLRETTMGREGTNHSYTNTKHAALQQTLGTDPKKEQTETKDVESEKLKNLDIPMILNNEKEPLSRREIEQNYDNKTEIKTNRTLSYNELSSVVVHYANLLRMNQGNSLYLETTVPEILASQKPLPTKTWTTDFKITTKRITTTSIPEADAHDMTEAPVNHVFNLLFDPFRHDVQTQAPCSPRNLWEENYEHLLKTLGSTPSELLFDSTTDTLDEQIQCTKQVTTPKVYSKGEVLAMGHKTYDPNHDPMWRSIYGLYKESTTAQKVDLMNVFDDPLGLYMRPDTEEEKERRTTELVNTTIYPYWRDLNKKYFASTVTVYPWQLTSRNINHTEEKQRPIEESITIPRIYSEEHYIETRGTTPPRGYRGYNLPREGQMHPEEVPRQFRSDNDPLDPEHMLDKRIGQRELDEQVKLNEDDAPGSSYMNLTASEQLCRDRAPVLRFFDDSKQFDSEGFKTMEGFSVEEYDQMQQIIADEIEEKQQQIRERKLNKTREEEERRRTTTPSSSEEDKGLRIDHIKFKHLGENLKVNEEMKDFKNKLKKQFDVIYERPSTTTISSPLKNTQHDMLMITNKDGVVIRRLLKIKKRRSTKNAVVDYSEMNFPTKKFADEGNGKHEKKCAEENEQFKRIAKRSITSNTVSCENIAPFIVVTNKYGKVIRKLQRVRKEKTTITTTAHRTSVSVNTSPHSQETKTCRMDLTRVPPFFRGKEDTLETATSNDEASTMRSRMIERFEKRKFTLPFETTEFTLEPDPDLTNMSSLERKFHRYENISVHDVTEGEHHRSLEKIIQQLTANLTEADLNKTITAEEREIDQVSEKYHKEFVGDIDGFDRDYEGNLVPTLSPAEIQKRAEELEREKIEYMRKARGEFNRFVSQETYDQLKEKRDVRIKHIEEYFDWQYKQEVEKELERQRRKQSSTETTPFLESCKIAENVTTEHTTEASTMRSKRIERFKNRKFTLPIETCVYKITQTTDKRDETSISPSIKSITTIYDKTSISASCKTNIRPITIATQNYTHTASTISQNTIGNTLVQQIFDYKRFNSNNKPRKSKDRAITILNTNLNRTMERRTKTTSTTISTLCSMEDYNISTTVDFIQCGKHQDHLQDMTDIPPRVFHAMKEEESELYQRYHNCEVSLDEFRNLRDKMIAKYMVYTKSTTPYTFPTFNITASIFPSIRPIESYADLRKEWKKIVAYEEKMGTAHYNDTRLQSVFSLVFTGFPTKVYPTTIRRYKRMVKSSRVSTETIKKRRKPYLDVKTKTCVPNKTTVRKSKKIKTPKTTRVQKEKNTLSIKSDISFIDIILSSSKKLNLKRTTRVFNAKKEIKTIQKQLRQFVNELNILKANISEVTIPSIKLTIGNATENKKEDTYTYFNNSSTVSNNVSTVDQQYPYEKLYLYSRQKDGKIYKYKVKLKQVKFENNETDYIEQEFSKKDRNRPIGKTAQEDIIMVWKTVKPRTADDFDGNLSTSWESNETTKDYNVELGDLHPHTLVTMVSDLYHKRMSLQNHIKYETTTSQPDSNRTYLYQLFGFNTRKPRLTTQNYTVQFSMFQKYRKIIQNNYKRVSNIQCVLEKYTKNRTIFSKNEQRYWDVFFYEKNIPQPKHPNGQVRWNVGIAPGDTRVALRKQLSCDCEECCYDSEEEYTEEGYSEDVPSSDESSILRQEKEFLKFIRERKCIYTTNRPMVFAWQLKSSLPIARQEPSTFMNPDRTATHFFFEMCEPP